MTLHTTYPLHLTESMTITKIERSTYNYDQDCYNMRIKMKAKTHLQKMIMATKTSKSSLIDDKILLKY